MRLPLALAEFSVAKRTPRIDSPLFVSFPGVPRRLVDQRLLARGIAARCLLSCRTTRYMMSSAGRDPVFHPHKFTFPPCFKCFDVGRGTRTLRLSTISIMPVSLGHVSYQPRRRRTRGVAMFDAAGKYVGGGGNELLSGAVHSRPKSKHAIPSAKNYLDCA